MARRITTKQGIIAYYPANALPADEVIEVKIAAESRNLVVDLARAEDECLVPFPHTYLKLRATVDGKIRVKQSDIVKNEFC